MKGTWSLPSQTVEQDSVMNHWFQILPQKKKRGSYHHRPLKATVLLDEATLQE